MSNPETDQATFWEKHTIVRRTAKTAGCLAVSGLAFTAAGSVDEWLTNGEHVNAVVHYMEGFRAHPPGQAPIDHGPVGDPDAKPTASPSATATKNTSPSHIPLIVLDPGHDGSTYGTKPLIIDKDGPNYKGTGLELKGYRNTPETAEVFDIALAVKKRLIADGYRVLLTKQHAYDNVTFRQRADIAMFNHADLGVSIHDDHGRGSSFQAVYAQFVNGYRGGGVDAKVSCEDSSVAAKSLRYAKLMAAARTAAQGHEATVQTNSFNGRNLEPGNLAIIQLFTCLGTDGQGANAVPWVYNEMGALTDHSPTAPITAAVTKAYEQGIINGIEAAVPITK